MALTPQPLRRADDPVSNTTVLGPIQPKNWRVWSNKFQAYVPSNPNENKPRYDSMDDWHGGVIGEDVGEADAAQAITGRNGGTTDDYEPRHQEEKAADWSNPPVDMLLDIGKDYGPYGGSAYHAGVIEPEMRYPSVDTSETPEQFRRSNYIPIPPPEPEP